MMIMELVYNHSFTPISSRGRKKADNNHKISDPILIDIGCDYSLAVIKIFFFMMGLIVYLHT